MSSFPPNNERPSPQLALVSLVIGLLAGLAYGVLLHRLSQPMDGIQIAAVGVCAAIATMVVPRLKRLSPEVREAAKGAPAVMEAGSFGAYLDETHLNMPTLVIAGTLIALVLLDLLFIAMIIIMLIDGNPENARFGIIARSAFITLLATLSARVLWRRRKARRRMGGPNC